MSEEEIVARGEEDKKVSLLIPGLTELEYELFIRNRGNRSNRKFLLDLLAYYDKQIEFLLQLEKLRELVDFYFDDKQTAEQVKGMLDAIIYMIKKKKENEKTIAQKIAEIKSAKK